MMDRITATDQSNGLEAHAQGMLRIVTGLLFMQHGVQKYFGWPPGGHAPSTFNLFSLFGIAGTLELFGGMALILGLYTRTIAFVLAGEMAIGYWFIHFPMGMHQTAGWLPVANGGDLAILFCFNFLFLAAAGPGSWALSRKR